MVFLGVPRRRIPWYPTINSDKCQGCGTCVNFCRNGVYKLEGNPERAVVVNPYNCIVGCSMCADLCPSEAIVFPSLEVVNKALEEYYSGKDWEE